MPEILTKSAIHVTENPIIWPKFDREPNFEQSLIIYALTFYNSRKCQHENNNSWFLRFLLLYALNTIYTKPTTIFQMTNWKGNIKNHYIETSPVMLFPDHFALAVKLPELLLSLTIDILVEWPPYHILSLIMLCCLGRNQPLLL